jgi:hypothetical protein
MNDLQSAGKLFWTPTKPAPSTVCCLAYSLSRNMEAAYYLIDFQRTTRCYIREDRTLKGKRTQKKNVLDCIRTRDLSVAPFYLSAKFLLALASTVILVPGSQGTHCHILLSNGFRSLQYPLNGW